MPQANVTIKFTSLPGARVYLGGIDLQPYDDSDAEYPHTDSDLIDMATALLPWAETFTGETGAYVDQIQVTGEAHLVTL